MPRKKTSSSTPMLETDRKHTYIKKIELKPWSEFENAVRKPLK